MPTNPDLTISLDAYLDGSPYDAEVGSLTDLSGYLLSVTVNGPKRSIDTERFTPGGATFVLDNRDGRFNPDDPSGAYYGRIGLFRPITLRLVPWGAPGFTSTQSVRTGTVVDDDLRSRGLEGDGRPVPDGTVGLYRGVTQLITNPNFAADHSGWAAVGATQLEPVLNGRFAGTSGRVTCAGSATGEGLELSPRVAVTAGTTYSLTSHVKAPNGATLRAVIEWWNALTGGATVGAAVTKAIAGTGAWAEVVATGKAPVGATHAVVRFETVTSAQGIQFQLGGVVLGAAYNPVPYRSSTAASYLAWLAGFATAQMSKTDGMIILRFRSGIDVANYDTTVDHYLWEWLLTGGAMRLRYIASAGSGLLQFDRYDAAPVTGVQVPKNLTRGDWTTVILKWTSTAILMSVDGTAFVSVANTLTAGTAAGEPTIGRATDGADCDIAVFLYCGATARAAVGDTEAATVHSVLAARRDAYLLTEVLTTLSQRNDVKLLLHPFGSQLCYSTSTQLFRGFIDRIDQGWDAARGISTAIVHCTDIFLPLGGQGLTASLTSTTVDDQIKEAVAQATTLSVVSGEGGDSPELAAVATLSVAGDSDVNLLGRAQQLAQDGEVWLFQSKNGGLRAESRAARRLERLSMVLGDADSPLELPYESLALSLDDDYLANDARLTPSTVTSQSSQGPLSPGTLANDTSFGVNAWTNPGNAAASDNLRAQAATFDNSTYYLKATNFGFSIPASATVLGIDVEVERRDAFDTATTDSRVRIVKGGVVGATDKASAAIWPASDTYASYGGPADLWGESWSAADINDSNFGFAISASSTLGGSPDIDHIRVTVYYSTTTTVELQQAENADAARRYGRRSLIRSVLLTSNTRVKQLAGRYVARFATPRQRIRSVTLQPGRNMWAWALLSHGDISGRLRVIRRPRGGASAIEANVFVDGYTITMPAGNGMDTRLELMLTEESEQGDFWICEDATYGVAGATTRAG